MLSHIFTFLINISFIWYFIISFILAVVVYPLEELYNDIFVIVRLISFIIFYFSIILFFTKKKK